MRFFLALAPQFDRIMGFDLDRAERLLVYQTDDRSQEEIRADDESSGEQARDQLPSSSEGSDHRRRLPHSRTAELSRFAVSKDFRQRCTDPEDRRMLRYITIGLIRGALDMCRDHDIQYVCAVMERSLIRLLGRLGFVFDHLGGLIEYHGARQPCVAQVNQIVSTAEGTFWWRHAG
jgi:hypothetical protein